MSTQSISPTTKIREDVHVLTKFFGEQMRMDVPTTHFALYGLCRLLSGTGSRSIQSWGLIKAA
jgi:hypothetical protein